MFGLEVYLKQLLILFFVGAHESSGAENVENEMVREFEEEKTKQWSTYN
jgi:hypothetical protein